MKRTKTLLYLEHCMHISNNTTYIKIKYCTHPIDNYGFGTHVVYVCTHIHKYSDFLVCINYVGPRAYKLYKPMVGLISARPIKMKVR